MATKKRASCQHDFRKEYMGGMDMGDEVCRKCGALATPADRKASSDVNENAHSVFQRLIERSEQTPNRGKLKKVEPPPTKKSGSKR